jgi:hypothetical protein
MVADAPCRATEKPHHSARPALHFPCTIAPTASSSECATGGAAFSINNNTPVNTEVLWGGGLWWGMAKGRGRKRRERQQGCSADIDGDGMVGIQDVLQILSDWGSSGSDVHGDGITNILDLLVAISQMGDCPER